MTDAKQRACGRAAAIFFAAALILLAWGSW